RAAFLLGCVGAWSLHPSQIAIARKVFSPPVEEVAFAKRVLEAMPDGRGVLMLDGKMQDDATWKQCKEMVTLAKLLAAKYQDLDGQPIRTRSTVVDRYRKRNRESVVNEVLVTDADGRWLQRSRTHQSFLIEDERRDTVVDREREKRPERVFTVGEGSGEPIGLLTRPITLAMCEAFSGPAKNYHNDREMARMLGFPDIVVQGMLSVCLVSELMTEAFGAGWLLGGKMDVRLVNVVWVDDVLATRGKVREEVAEGSHRRVHLDVWCEKADGAKALVGTASALR